MANPERKKVNRTPDSVRKDVIAIAVLLLVIAGYIFYECFTATHVEVETITAVTSTVYESIEAKALVVRDEHTISADNGAVTVACVADGDKVKVGGNIAMKFSSEENAKSFSQLQRLHNDLDYYIELESRSAGVVSDIETLDRDILSDVNSFVRAAGGNNVDKLSSCAADLNDKLTRRQIIIGQDIDFTAAKDELQSQINAINASACAPSGYVTAEQSGIFSSFTDGLETAFDYNGIEEMNADTLRAYMEQAGNSQNHDSTFGKLITSYKWYLCAVVSAKDVSNIKNGESLDVAIKDSDKVIKCTVVSGADVPLGAQETVLVLSSSQMDGSITSMRLEDIEIRYNSYSGFKVPSSAVHVDDNGNKCVYALVANVVSLREGEIIYSTKDYSIFAYDPQSSNTIRFYDQIITKGKDLRDGKVYT